ncbi:hypothetical protein AK830_g5484 [Neonectria ditissima]|uniref:Clr5 domain-containing protein n=1 Tax=Neonectria ditissima TaxID=78410 RepID=A0A0P7B3X5_9HYPO|nr:hypothetical protein AK830_g5484 [Neonectria ditissima]
MPVDWSQYESEVLRLYVEEGKTAEETIKCLNQQHGSGITSIRQFKAKFGGLKKLRATEWQEVGRKISKRQDQGKTSEVYVCGQLQGPARVRRALQHSKTKRDLSETEIDWGLELHKLRRVEIRTPEPRVHNQLEIKTLAAPSAEPSHPSGAEYQENNQSLTPGDGNFLNELGIDIDDMELDFSTPKLDHYFNTEKFSSANSPQPAAITNPRMAPSFFAAHNEAYDLSLNEERALRTGTAFSPFAAHSTSQVSPREASMTHQSTELLAFPESLRFNTSNFETVLPSSIDWDQLRRRVLMGQAGWLESQLRSVDSNPMIQTSTLGLLEKVLETTSNGKEIRFDGFNQESLHEMFFVVTRLVSNRFLDWKPLINFMRWIIQNGSVGELFKFLEARLYNRSITPRI